MLKKVFTICAVSVLSYSLASGDEIVVDTTDYENGRNDSIQVVYDSKTNLMWQDDESAKSVRKDWEGAIDYCQNLNAGGYRDWRVPSIEELKSIVDKNNSPKIKSEFKNTASGVYWSSTPEDSYFSTEARVMEFLRADRDGKLSYNHSLNVRCVRDNISGGYHNNNKGNDSNEKNTKKAPDLINTGSL